MAQGWKNPLWKRPSEWKVLGKGGRPAARPERVAEKLVMLMQAARLRVQSSARAGKSSTPRRG